MHLHARLYMRCVALSHYLMPGASGHDSSAQTPTPDCGSGHEGALLLCRCSVRGAGKRREVVLRLSFTTCNCVQMWLCPLTKACTWVDEFVMHA